MDKTKDSICFYHSPGEAQLADELCKHLGKHGFITRRTELGLPVVYLTAEDSLSTVNIFMTTRCSYEFEQIHPGRASIFIHEHADIDMDMFVRHFLLDSTSNFKYPYPVYYIARKSLMIDLLVADLLHILVPKFNSKWYVVAKDIQGFSYPVRHRLCRFFYCQPRMRVIFKLERSTLYVGRVKSSEFYGNADQMNPNCSSYAKVERCQDLEFEYFLSCLSEEKMEWESSGSTSAEYSEKLCAVEDKMDDLSDIDEIEVMSNRPLWTFRHYSVHSSPLSRRKLRRRSSQEKVKCESSGSTSVEYSEKLCVFKDKSEKMECESSGSTSAEYSEKLCAVEDKMDDLSDIDEIEVISNRLTRNQRADGRVFSDQHMNDPKSRFDYLAIPLAGPLFPIIACLMVIIVNIYFDVFSSRSVVFDMSLVGVILCSVSFLLYCWVVGKSALRNAASVVFSFDQIQVGDHISYKRGLFGHQHSIVVKSDEKHELEVVFWSKGRPQRETISVSRDMAECRLYLYHYNVYMSLCGNEVAKRANECSNMFFLNDKHFAQWCKCGIATSLFDLGISIILFSYQTCVPAEKNTLKVGDHVAFATGLFTFQHGIIKSLEKTESSLTAEVFILDVGWFSAELRTVRINVESLCHYGLLYVYQYESLSEEKLEQDTLLRARNREEKAFTNSQQFCVWCKTGRVLSAAEAILLQIVRDKSRSKPATSVVSWAYVLGRISRSVRFFWACASRLTLTSPLLAWKYLRNRRSKAYEFIPHANETFSADALPHSSGSHSSVVTDDGSFFKWLDRQPWAVRYSRNSKGFVVEVQNICKYDADMLIRKANFGNLKYKLQDASTRFFIKTMARNVVPDSAGAELSFMDWCGNTYVALCSGVITNGEASRVLTVGHVFTNGIGLCQAAFLVLFCVCCSCIYFKFSAGILLMFGILLLVTGLKGGFCLLLSALMVTVFSFSWWYTDLNVDLWHFGLMFLAISVCFMCIYWQRHNSMQPCSLAISYMCICLDWFICRELTVVCLIIEIVLSIGWSCKMCAWKFVKLALYCSLSSDPKLNVSLWIKLVLIVVDFGFMLFATSCIHSNRPNFDWFDSIRRLFGLRHRGIRMYPDNIADLAVLEPWIKDYNNYLEQVPIAGLNSDYRDKLSVITARGHTTCTIGYETNECEFFFETDKSANPPIVNAIRIGQKIPQIIPGFSRYRAVTEDGDSGALVISRQHNNGGGDNGGPVEQNALSISKVDLNAFGDQPNFQRCAVGNVFQVLIVPVRPMFTIDFRNVPLPKLIEGLIRDILLNLIESIGRYQILSLDLYVQLLNMLGVPFDSYTHCNNFDGIFKFQNPLQLN